MKRHFNISNIPKSTIFWFGAFIAVSIVLLITARLYSLELKSNIVFGYGSTEDYYDNDSDITVVGPLTGDDMENAAGYGFVDGNNTNNSTFLKCDQYSMECQSYYVIQIGDKQVSELSAPTIFKITSWNTWEVVATNADSDPSACTQVTINIDRPAKTVEWVQEPINQSALQCKNADEKTYKWSLGDPIE